MSERIWRLACIWSSWALLPMVAVLAFALPWAALTYAASATVAFLYHCNRETRFVAADHALAWTCVALNLWLAWMSTNATLVAAAIAFIAVALYWYRASHRGGRDCYDRGHTLWHLACGAGGLCLALAQ